MTWYRYITQRKRVAGFALALALGGASLAHAQIERVSVATDGTRIRGADVAALSRNGRVVAFTGREWVNNDVDIETVLYVRDLDAKVTERLPLTTNAIVSDVTISDDGAVVAFRSSGRLLPGVSNVCPSEWNPRMPCQNAYVYDRTSRQLTLASVASDGAQASGHSYGVGVSGNGRYVFFTS